MATEFDPPHDQLWNEYSLIFREFDDLTLGRWMAQTLGQLAGRSWRISHPLVSAYRLAAQIGHDRQIWLKRLAAPPSAYPEASCCRAPLLALLTRDVVDSGLICEHCGETAVPLDELDRPLQKELRRWSEQYAKVHEVAHWTEAQQKACPDYDEAFEQAAKRGEDFLRQAGRELAPALLDFFPAIIWEDQDECLEIRPEDVQWETSKEC